MSETRRFTALDWVRGEIEDTLRGAREALESFVEQPDDITLARRCLTALHQVHGTLQMVELEGAAELAGEMEAVAQALLGRSLVDEAAGQEALMEGILQLPSHLARVQQGGVDDAGLHRPLIQRLRAARGEADAAAADDVVEIDPSSVSLFLSGKGPAAVRKLRSSYQRAMLALMRKAQPPEKLWPFFEKLFTRLEHVTPASPIARLWWLAAGAMERYAERGGPVPTMLPVLRGLDQQLKELVEATEATLTSRPPEKLVEQLRAVIAQPADGDSSRLLALRRAFPAPGEQPAETIPLGADAATIATVAGALHEELRGVRDRLDLFVRGSAKDADALAALGDDLQRISGTLAVVGLSGLRETVDRQAAWIRQQAHSGSIDDEAMMEIAGAVLLVDSALMSMAGIEDEDGETMPGSLSDAQAAVLREARVSLETVKQAIVDFVASEWDHAHLDPVADTLAAVRRVLQVVPLDRAAGLVDACRRFLVHEILDERLVPEWQRLDTLADAVTSIDYFLERMLQDGGAMDPRVLDIAEESVRALGYDLELPPEPAPEPEPAPPAATEAEAEPEPVPEEPVPPAAPPAEPADATSALREPTEEDFDLELLGEESPAPAAPAPAEASVGTDEDEDSLIDDDIIEIFLEECGEVLETLDTHLGSWREDLSDRPALTEIRRAFHTLKGSGRMVGATTLGEMAWAVENMLNRVLDHTVEASAPILEVVLEARERIPALREAFAEGREAEGGVHAIVEKADVLASGGSLADLDAAAEDEDAPIVADDDALLAEEPGAALAGLAEDDALPEAPEFDLSEVDQNVAPVSEDAAPVGAPEATDYELAAELDEAFLGLDAEAEGDGIALSGSEDLESALAEESDFVPAEDPEATDDAETLPEIREEELSAEADDELLPEEDASHEAPSATEPAPWTAAEAAPEAPLDAEVEEEAAAAAETDAEEALRAASAFDMPSGISEPVEPDFDLGDLEPAAAPRPTLVEGSGEAERGDELLEVFVSEAEGHLAVLRAFDAGEGLDDPDDPPPTEQALRRALHTLKGSAAMAEYPGIAGAVGPLERLLRAHLELQRPLDDRARALLRSGRGHLEDALAVLRRDGLEPIGDAEARAHALEVERRAVELEDEVAAVRRGAAAGTTTSDVLTGEHMDALLDGAELVRAWSATGDDAALPALRAELDALAERASDAGRAEIAGLATALGAAHGRLGGVQPDAEATDTLARAHESLVAMLDALAADLAHGTDTALVDALEAVGTPAPGAAAEGPAVEEPPALVPPAPPAPEATPFFRESVADVDLDPEMAEIFFEEAEELLENIDAGFGAWSDGDRAGPDMLVRALHTLKGGARMAGLAGLGDEGHELETWIEGHRDGEGPEFFPTLRRRIDALAEHVARLRRGETLERPPAPEPPAPEPAAPEPAAPEPTPAGPVPSAEEARAPATALPERPGLGVDDPARADPDALEPFLEEATELAEAMDGALASWRAEASNELHLETLLRSLHTLKGGARMAGLPALGEAVHDLESRVEGARGRTDLRDGSFFTNLQLNADALSGRIAAIADAVGTGAAPAGTAPVAEASSPAPAAPQAPAPTPAAEAAPAAPADATGPAPMPSREAPVREASQEMIRVASSLLDGLANLAGESSILRGRIAQQIGDFGGSLDEMGATIERIRSQVRRLELETEAQVLFRQERSEKAGYEDFDPLEMDRYTQLQELARTLAESASDVNDLRETLLDRVRDAETLLVQQGRIHTDLQEGLMRTRMVPFARLLPRLRRIVRQVAREVGKKVELELRDAEGELDRNVLERMIPPLEHMLRNAVDHGIEDPGEREQRGKAAEGTIRLSLSREGGDIVLEVADDGGGIDVEAVRRRAIDRGLLDAAAAPSEDEILSFIMAPGFSTARNVTQISGRGVGMDVVNSEVKQLGGSISIASTWDVGTTISVRLPFTVSVNRALMVTVGEDEYAVPLSGIEGIVRVSPQQLLRQYESDASDFAYAGRTYELSYLGAWLGLPHRVRQDLPSVPVLMVRAGDRGRAVHVDTVAGSREIVVKSLGPQFAGLSGVSGATILGDGRVVVILDLPSLLRSSSQLRLSGPAEAASAPPPSEAVTVAAADAERAPQPTATTAVEPPQPTVVVPERTRVLVVDDSVTVRKVTTRLLERQGMAVSVAKDGVEAVGALAEQKPDVMLLDIEMPRMDGFEVAQHVRNEPELAELPIIMITSRTGEKHQSRAREIGVDRFLGKPFQEAELVATIEELTGR